MTELAPSPSPASIPAATSAPASVPTPASAPAPAQAPVSIIVSTSEASEKLLEYVRSGKFSPTLAAQIEGAINAGEIQIPRETPGLTAKDYDLLRAIQSVLTVCAIVLPLFGAISLSLSLSGIVDNPWLMLTAAILFITVLLAIVSFSGFRQQPVKVKKVEPRRGKARSLRQPGGNQPAAESLPQANTI